MKNLIVRIVLAGFMAILMNHSTLLAEAVPEETTLPERESVATARFGVSSGQSGLSGCKTEALSKNVIKDLKADCLAWVKDQKADLKTRFLTSSCEESCEDCGMSLRRCFVTGTVKYLLK